MQEDMFAEPQPGEQGKCRSCGQAIVWEINAKGHKMPMNPEVQPNGKRVTHFANCPQAGSWRKKKAAT